MEASFDPYRNWFGIDNDAQPLNHYRLLGLKNFESSTDRIEAAVAKRAEFLQALSMGQHVSDAQRIMNEVARARLCLIKPDRKAAYDQALKDQLASNTKKPVPMAIPIAAEVDDASALKDLQVALDSRKRPSRSGANKKIGDGEIAQQKKSGGLLGLILAATALLVIIGGGIIFLINNNSTPEIAEQTQTENLPTEISKTSPAPASVKAPKEEINSKKAETKPKPKLTPARRNRIRNRNANKEKSDPVSKKKVPTLIANPLNGYNAFVDYSGNNSANVCFEPSGQTKWVNLHYTVGESGQANVKMKEDQDGKWNWEIPKLAQGAIVDYWFTFYSADGAVDTAHQLYVHAKSFPAGEIVWSKALASSGVQEVSTKGVLVEAINANTSNDGETTVVNGVNFVSKTFAKKDSGQSDFSTVSNGGDLGYDKILSSLSYGTDLNEILIGDGKLRANRTYEIQLWYIDQRKSYDSRVMEFGDSAGNFVQLNDAFAIGRFVANETGSQVLRCNEPGGNMPHLTAYQIRDVSPGDVVDYGDPKPLPKPTVLAKGKSPKVTPKVTLPQFPLANFPTQLALPGFETTSPTKLADLFISENSPFDLKLEFEKSGAPTGTQFGLSAEANANRSWIVSTTTNNQPSVEIARFYLDGFDFNFQWLAAAASAENAGHFSNGTLLVNAGETRKVGLRIPFDLRDKGKTFAFLENKFSVDCKFEFSNAPNSKSISLELLKFNAWPLSKSCFIENAVITKSRPAVMRFTEKKEDSFVRLEVEGSASATQSKITISAKLKMLDEKEKWVSIRKSNELSTVHGRALRKLDQKKAQLKATADRKSKGDLSRDIERLTKRLESVNAQLKAVEQVVGKTIVVKVTRDASDKKFILAKSGGIPANLKGFNKVIPELDEYKLVLEADFKKIGKQIKYDLDLRSQVQKFDRVAYLLELKHTNRNRHEYAYVSAKTFTDDIRLIGIPTGRNVFAQRIESMNVYSTHKNFRSKTNLPGGYIEFWPFRSLSENVKKIPGASNKFDFGDRPGKVGDDGSMQIHSIKDKQTIFGISDWKSGGEAGIGIGNNDSKDPKAQPDWTSAKNAKLYTTRRLKIFVRPISESQN